MALWATMGLTIWAEVPGVRISAPVLSWALSPDGSQLIEIAGVIESPRLAGGVTLAGAAQRVWPSPDGARALVLHESGLSLYSSGPASFETIFKGDLSSSSVSAEWDRSSLGFAACWDGLCQTFSPAGAKRTELEVTPASRVMAFSADGGLVMREEAGAVWRRGSDAVRFETAPAAAAFRPGTAEVWLLDAAGRLEGRDWQGRRTGGADLVANALGLVASLDGRGFLAVNADGQGAVIQLESNELRTFEAGRTVEGVWAAPGFFTARLHESAKRPIGFWNAETGASGWSPAVEAREGSAEAEVLQ